jgi:acetyltransferase
MTMHAPAERWQFSARTRDGASYRIRPIRASDGALEKSFLQGLTPQSRYNRLMCAISEPSENLISSLVHVDYERSMAFVAVLGEDSEERIIGVARYAADPGSFDCEFAVTISDSWQSRGIGTTLMRLLFDYAREHGMRRIYGRILASNTHMLDLARWVGLTIDPRINDDNTVAAWFDLQAPERENNHGKKREAHSGCSP